MGAALDHSYLTDGINPSNGAPTAMRKFITAPVYYCSAGTAAELSLLGLGGGKFIVFVSVCLVSSCLLR